jgi:outer membrane receptor protein involved in Fe transport
MHVTILLLALQVPVPRDTVRQLPPLVVTATRESLLVSKSPLPAASLDFTRLRRDIRPSLADVVSAVPGVRAQTTGMIIAKPVIRGLGGARVLTLDGGHRLEDYSWSDEDGPALDPRLAERIEVIRGPASLLYGSDAIGGVINAIPEPLAEAAPDQLVRHVHGELFGSSNNPGGGAGLEAEWARGAWSARISGVAHLAGNTATPDCELENTGFTSLNGEASLGVHGAAGRATLRFARFGGAFKLLEAGGAGASIPAGCPGGPPKPATETGTGPEREVEDNRIQLEGETHWLGMRLELKSQFQDHTTIEKSDDITPGQEVETIHLGLTTETVDLLAHHRIGTVEGTFGFSGLAQDNATSGLAPLVPAATTRGAALFAIERIPLGRLSVLAGLRGDVRRLEADTNASLGTSPRTRDAAAWTGDVGATYELAPGLVLGANVGRAFRAPNLFELFSNGPRLGEARYEIGDATLKPEASLNLDVSLRWQTSKLRGEVAAYHNRISNFIFITPTSQYRPDPDTAAHDSLRVYSYGQAQATLWGGEASLAVDATERVTSWVRAEYVHGDNDSQGQPLPLMPPARVTVGAELHAAPGADRCWHAGADVEGIARQTRLSSNDIPTSGYVLLGLSGGWDARWFGRDLRLDARVRNVLDARYRSFLNRYKEFALDAGRAIEIRIGTEF